jgi:hypothetical protein
MSEINPFQVGGVVLPEHFINHQREIRRARNTILTGQSIAITGEPRSGKTSLLHYLMSKEKQIELYGERTNRLRFSYSDVHTFGNSLTPAEFWKRTFIPLLDVVLGNASFRSAYKACEKTGFTSTQLETLLSELQAEDWRLVVMIDEFDEVLRSPNLNQTLFYGVVRSLASRYHSLVVILASRKNIGHFNTATQTINPIGSPYFNIMQEIAIQPFKPRDARSLLLRADELFDVNDLAWLWKIAGGHPYLLQAAASTLWETCQDGECDPAERRRQAGNTFYLQTVPTLADTWRLWSPEMKKTFAIVGLDNLPALLNPDHPQRFDIETMVQTLPEYIPELRQLETHGFITPASGIPGQWKVQAEVMLWWLSEALIKAMREGDGVGRWLQAEGWEGLLKKGEKETLFQAVKTVGGLLPTGIDLLAKTAAAIKEIGG